MDVVQNWKTRLDNRDLTVAVIGLGYVGLPLAVEFAEEGLNVVGVDIDSGKIEAVARGESYILDVASKRLQEVVGSGKLKGYTALPVELAIDAISIAVPTPLSKSKSPDVAYIASAMDGVRAYVRGRRERGLELAPLLVVLESTTYPGTTRELVLAPMEEEGLVLDDNLFVAFSPERVDPGNPQYQTRNTPKVLGGVSTASGELACALYPLAVDTVVPVATSEEAEMVKLLENTFRAVNIAMVNELTIMADRMGINMWHVIEAAKTKPFGFMPFYPGPGIGGHCIPLDPMYLSWKAKFFGYYNRFIELASDINDNMPEFAVHKLMNLLNERGRCIKGSRILLLGVAYKPNVDDLRESPALVLWERLAKMGAVLSFNDPLAPRFKNAQGDFVDSTPLTPKLLGEQEVVIVTTAHKVFDWEAIRTHAPLIFDARGVYKEVIDPNIVQL